METNNRSQAGRLSKASTGDLKRVDVAAAGTTRIISPAGETWSSWFDGDDASADFNGDREQPADQQRESC